MEIKIVKIAGSMFRAGRRRCLGLSACFSLIVAACFVCVTTVAHAQTAGEGAIQGIVTDSSGAVIPHATVTATNTATSVAATRQTTGEGIYLISPLLPGTYTVTVAVAGFQDFRQENLIVTAMNTYTLNVKLSVGSSSQQITVSAAPPAIDTTTATLGATISSDVYLQLPILANNQQRDITSVSNLLPGAQPGARSSLFSGTASRVEEVYLDGIPLTTISQIGDNRPILNLVPAESIDQINVVTNSASAEYQGAGMVNYTTKSGGNKYHGTVADYVRNTIFDTWGFTAIAATKTIVVDGVNTTVPVGKPIDHQNELTASIGGPIIIPHLFNGSNKLFFFASYDRFRSRSGANPSAVTIPTTAFQGGDFSSLLASNGGPGYAIYDPTSLTTCTANSTTGPCRYQFGYGPGTGPGPAGNPVTNGQPINVIPATMISPIAQYMQKFLPTPSTSAIVNNYVNAPPSGYDNWLYSGRVDYDVSERQRISGVVTGGNRQAYPFTAASSFNNSTLNLPLPYTGSDYSIIAGHWADIEDAYTINQNLVNQFRFGWSNFGGPPLKNLTEGITQYAATTAGINFSGVPATGQALTEFPTVQFSGSNAPNTWGFGSDGVTATTVSQTYTTLDNLLWIKGKHAFTFGFQLQKLQENASVYDGPTSALTMAFSPSETASVVPGSSGGSAYGGNTGFAYASFLLGAVNGTGITLQPFSVLGGRYSTYAPYFQDVWKITSKLTLNLGVRWDYLPPYHEVLNRYSFLNPSIANPVTGNNGALQFAGSWGGSGVACNCATPVQTYWKNWQPRIGFNYALNDKTVISAGYATVYSHAGGTGGAGGAYNGTGQLGFTSSPSYADNAAGPSAGPVFYLNNSTGFQSLGIANNNFGGPGYTVPAITPPGAISQTLNVGNTVSSTGAFIKASSAPGFADSYLSGRAPQFNFWNFQVQRAFTNNITVSVAYAGTEGHFVAGASNMRGLYSGQIDPKYWVLGTLLNAAATPANIAAAQAILPGLQAPYASFEQAAETSGGAGQATIGQMLKWMPQFSSTSDTWGSSSANTSYHALQISARKRMSNGLDLTVNYTYSKNIDDAGTQRSGFAIPAGMIATGKAWAVNRIDRSLSANSIPQDLNIYGVYNLPFGKQGWSSSNPVVRSVVKGWNLSGLFTYSSGTPLLVTSSACSSSTHPGAGTCMPDLNSAFTSKTIRQNGSWGKGITAKTFSSISYLQGYVPSTQDGVGVSSSGTAAPCASSTGPFCNAGAFMFGDAGRVMPFDGLRNPGAYNLSGSVFRTFDLTERLKFVFRADCQNITNKVTFGGIQTSMNSAAFGTVSSATGNTGSRDFQFSGRINF
jgi:hypothetical protein